jgi:bacillithiol biosynthesis cysteine-adding enzyme BshC
LADKLLPKSLYHEIPSMDAIENAITRKRLRPINRKVLVEELRKSYSGFGFSSKVANDEITNNPTTLNEITNNQITALQNENTFTITTGHQLNIFTGPLYFIYKICSCIALCKEAKDKFPQYNFVPVYWMASEDHDMAEISSTTVLSEKIEWKQTWQGCSGKAPLPGFDSLIEGIKILLSNEPNINELVAIFEKSYLQSHNLAEATFKLVHHMFHVYGLIIIDADNANLKALFKDIFKKELNEQFSFNSLSATNQQLQSTYDLQIKPREINLFYNSPESRNRIVKNGDKFEVLNTDISFTESDAWVDANFANMSPNVVLRPLYQEFILPNLAYIGGPGEVGYWLQLKSTFDAVNVTFPLIVLRDSFLLLDAKTQEVMTKLCLTDADLVLTTDELSRKYIESKNTNVIDFGEQQRTAKAIQAIEDKIIKALKRQDEVGINKIQNLKSKLFPNGSFQERTINFSQYYATYGNKFVDKILSHSNPLNTQLKILKL